MLTFLWYSPYKPHSPVFFLIYSFILINLAAGCLSLSLFYMVNNQHHKRSQTSNWNDQAMILTLVGYLGLPPVAITMFLAVRIVCFKEEGNMKERAFAHIL